MAKKSWFSLLRNIFISETPSNRDKRQKKRGWIFGRFKIKRLPSISAPSPSRERTSEAEEEQSKHDDSVAISTPVSVQCNTPPSTPQCEREGIHELAATKIQTAFRAYLARKALRALKGLVKLQAIIRGRLVRRQAITTLNRLQSIVNIQSQVCAKRSQMADGALCCQENKELPEFKGKDIKIDVNSQRRWDDSLLTKEEENALCSSKRMASIKRERIKEYSFSFSNRRSAELEQNKVDGRWRYWLEQWVDTRLAKREDLETLASVFSSSARIRDESGGKTQHKSRNLQKQHHNEGLDLPSGLSFHHRKQRSIGDGSSAGGGSPVVPTYMAATESAKAKVRSLSSPRLRPINFDAHSEAASPYKHKLSPISSINSEATTISMLTNPSARFSQRSPCLKGPVKLHRSYKYFGFDSECCTSK